MRTLSIIQNFCEQAMLQKQKQKYNELATQLQSAVITNSFLTGKQKLTGKVITTRHF